MNASARRKIEIIAVSAVVVLLLGWSSGGAAPQNEQANAGPPKTWTAPDPATIPSGPLGDTIRLGLRVFDDTPKFAAPFVGNKMSCGHCHVGSGTVAGAMPLVGVPGMFPLYRDRERTVVTFEERIEQCFQRSEHGHRVPNDNPVMVGLVAYAQWLSRDQPVGHSFPGRGLVKLPELSGDSARGGELYAQQCEVCHGVDGSGKPAAIPAVWGPDAFDAGAGMNEIARMAAFVQHNMPLTLPGSLSPQQAYDVAAYIHSKPHLPFDIREHQ